jgi:DNA-binding IclR family transcriptional regulator
MPSVVYEYCTDEEPMAITADSNKSTTALRALKVLEILGASRAPVSVASVAQGIDADRSTAYRMLMTLMEAGYVTRDEASKHYKLGYKLLSLTKYLLNDDQAAELVMASLRGIAEQTGESVHYCVLDRLESVLLYRVKGVQLVAVDFQIGDRSPLHCTSIGKVLLAHQDERLLGQVVAGGLRRFARRTIVEPDALRAELRRVRRQGYAYDEFEFADDMRCVAVPVFGKGGRLHGGISLSGPSSRYTQERLAELRDCTLHEAHELSARLGFEPPAP